MARTTVIFAIDFAQDAQVFAQMCTLAVQAGIPMQVGAGASAQAPAQADAPAPAPAPVREYEPTHDVVLAVRVLESSVTYTAEDGSYMGTSGVRKAMNARLRAAGASYDKDARVWTFPSAEDAQAFAGDGKVTVTAAEWQAQRDRAAAKAARKG